MNPYDLFESIDIIISSRLKELELDRTLVCEIVNNDVSYTGKYTVSYENAHFFAESTDMSFKVGDLVYVGVPTNNYNNAFIICKKIKNANSLSQSNPFHDFIELLDYKPDNTVIWSYDADTCEKLPTKAHEEIITHTEPYTHLGISATFNSLIQCPWGVIIYVITREFQGQDQSDELQSEIIKIINDHTLTTNEQENLIIQKRNQYARNSYLKTSSYIWSSNDMTGNARNYQVDFIQQKLIDISDLKNIEKIQLYIYADNPAQISELQIKNLEFVFGYAMSNYAEENLEIYTSGTTTYNQSSERELYCKWIKMNNGAPTAITYRNQDNQIGTAQIIWQEYGSNGWANLVNGTSLRYTVTLNPYKSQEQYRCIIRYTSLEASAPIEIISNVLTFKNIAPNSSNIVKDATVKMTTDIQDFSSYYNVDGTVADLSLSKTTRNIVLTASTQDLSKIEDNINLNIVWKIAKDNTMLSYAGFIADSSEETDTEHVYIQRITDIKSNIVQQKITAIFPFKINTYLLPAYINNLISCEIQVERNGAIVQTDQSSIGFDFSRPNISPNDYILILNLYQQGQLVHSIKSQETLTIKPQLYDAYGKEQLMTNNVTYEWYTCPKESILLSLKQYESNKTLCAVQAQSFSSISNRLYYKTWQNQCYIVKATYRLGDAQNGQQEVVSYLPIALNLDISSTNPMYLSGPTQVMYDNSGSNPSYYHGSYSLCQLNQASGEYMTMSGILFIDSNYNIENENPYYPKLGTVSEQTCLCPKSIFMEEANTGYCVIGMRKQNEIPLWVQPILLYQTLSFSSFINEWSGQLEIGGRDSNTAMMARLGTGKQNPDGTFSGILLGDWKKQIQNGSWKSWQKEHTGLYGYNHNAEAYGFRDDGSAFLGKAGAGRINFNGEMGLIYSGNFDGSFYSVDFVEQMNRANSSITSLTFGPETPVFQIGISSNASANTGNTMPHSNWKLAYLDEDALGETIQFSGEVGKDEQVSYGQDAKYDASDELSAVIYLGDKIQPGSYIFEEVISLESQKVDKAYDSTSEICLNLDNIDPNEGCYLMKENGDQVYIGDLKITYLDIGALPGFTANQIRLYFSGKFHIRMQITISESDALQDCRYLRLPMLTFLGIVGERKLISKRQFVYYLSNIQFYKVESSEQGEPLILDASQIEAKNISTIKLVDPGHLGTFLNLKEGELITNNATFRGKLQVESMELLNEVIIGDPTGADGSSWIRITPDGRFLSSDVAAGPRFVPPGTSKSDIYYNPDIYKHKDIIISPGDSSTSNYLYFVEHSSAGNRHIYCTTLEKYSGEGGGN